MAAAATEECARPRPSPRRGLVTGDPGSEFKLLPSPAPFPVGKRFEPALTPRPLSLGERGRPPFTGAGGGGEEARGRLEVVCDRRSGEFAREAIKVGVSLGPPTQGSRGGVESGLTRVHEGSPLLSRPALCPLV